MTTYCGKNGRILIGTHPLAETKEFTLDISNDVIMTPAFQQDGKRKIACGPYDWKGTISCYWDMTDTAGQKALHDATINGTTVTAELYVRYIDGADYMRYSGTIYIPSQSITVNSDGAVAEVSFTYEGSGDLSLTGIPSI